MAPRRRAVGRLMSAITLATRPGSPSLWQRLQSLPRLVSATLRGDYDKTSLAQLALMAAATAYLISPVDLLPEAVLGVLGLIDDTVVLAWLASTLVEETEGFLHWEDQAGGGRPGSPSTVRGRVLR
ncbi:MAG: YkvA family protein [Nostocoides sp.]